MPSGCQVPSRVLGLKMDEVKKKMNEVALASRTGAIL